MSVADARGRRWDAATGLAFVVLGVVGVLLPGAPPKADDSMSKINDFLVGHRDDLLVGNFLLALSLVFFFWFLGSLRSYLRAAEGGEGRLSAAAFGGGVAGGALTLVGTGLFSGIAFKVAKSGSPDVVRAFFDAANMVLIASAPAFAAFLAAASCSAARTGALPGWLVWSGSVVAVLQVVSAVSLFVESGAFAFGGAFGLIALAAAFLWIAAVSVVVMRRDGVPPVARAEP